MLEADHSEEHVVHVAEQAAANNVDGSVHDSHIARLDVSSTATYRRSVPSEYQDLEHVLSTDLVPTSDNSSFVFMIEDPQTKRPEVS